MLSTLSPEEREKHPPRYDQWWWTFPATGRAPSPPGSRAEFYAEMLATRERISATHLAILEKLDANHRELLAALERVATRTSALEAGLARVDERTRK